MLFDASLTEFFLLCSRAILTARNSWYSFNMFDMGHSLRQFIFLQWEIMPCYV